MKRRIVCSAMALEGHGKSRFSLTAPRPLLALVCDPNTEAVVCKEFEVDSADDLDPDICRLVNIPFPLVGFESNEDDIMREAEDSWNLLCDEIGDVLRGKARIQPRTVILDSGSELNQLNILKDFGRTDKIHPKVRMQRMGKTNNDFKGIFRALEKAEVHVVVTHRVREHWETVKVRGGDDKQEVVSGVFDRIGFKEIGNICNTEVLLKFDPEREGKLSSKFGMQLLRSMHRPALIGEEWWGRVEVEGGRVGAASFAHLGTLLFPSTTLDDWT